jgi:hypothetical protein
MEELLGDEYYVELFAEIADSEPITEAIDEVSCVLRSAARFHFPPCAQQQLCPIRGNGSDAGAWVVHAVYSARRSGQLQGGIWRGGQSHRRAMGN